MTFEMSMQILAKCYGDPSKSASDVYRELVREREELDVCLAHHEPVFVALSELQTRTLRAAE